MLIDSRTGYLALPIGTLIAPDLGRHDFLAMTADAEPWVAHGPYASFRLAGGSVAGRSMNVIVFFYDEMLTMTQFGFSFYAEAAQGWEDWSAEIEMQTKDFQERLLRDDLGEPHVVNVRKGEAAGATSGLGVTLHWAYAWGEVASQNDLKSASTSVVVSYAGRRERAYADYQRWKQREARLAEATQQIRTEQVPTRRSFWDRLRHPGL